MEYKHTAFFKIDMQSLLFVESYMSFIEIVRILFLSIISLPHNSKLFNSTLTD